MTEPVTPDVDDVEPTRIRLSLDLVRLSGLAAVLLVLAGLGSVARDTGAGLSEDLTRLVNDAPAVIDRLFSVLGDFVAIAIPLTLSVVSIVRGQTRRLLEALGTALLAIGLAELISATLASLPSSALYDALTKVAAHGSVRALDAYLTGLLAFLTLIGLAKEPLWRVPIAAMVALYVVAAFAVSDASLLSLLSSMTIGAMVGVLVRYVAGQPNDQPDGQRIAAELARRGLALATLTRVGAPELDYRSYVATSATGEAMTVDVLDRDLIASGAVHNFYRLLRLRREIAPPPALSLERVAERRSLLALIAADADVRMPRLLAGVTCGPDTIVLAYGREVTTPMVAPTQDQLDDLWDNVARLHEHRMTHRGLVAGRILLDRESRVVLPIPADGSAFATDLRINLERAQLLMTCAQLAGAEEAVRSARTVLTADELAAALPLLQPIAFDRDTRRAVKRAPGLLEGVRDQIQGQAEGELPDAVRVERVRPRTVVSVAALLVAAYLIVGEFGTVHLNEVFASARWQWVPLVAAASVGTYVAAALSLTGYVRERLSFARTVLVQVAASFAGFVTPPSVGGLAVNIRYLRRSKVSAAGAATSVGMSQVINAASHVVLLTIFAAATGTSDKHSLPIPGWVFLAVGGLVVVALLAMSVPKLRHALTVRVLPPLREALPRLLDLLTSPVKLAEGVLGALLLNACYIGALWFSVHAFNGGVALASVAVVYLTGAAIGSLAPTPGGLGAVEVALSTGLAAAGMPGTAAVSAVLLFRIATFWLPVPFGWAALHWLQRREAV